MGDMGDDIAKSLATGCLAAIVMIGVWGALEWYLVKVFLLRPPVHFDGILLFSLLTIFFIGSFIRFWFWATDKF